MRFFFTRRFYGLLVALIIAFVLGYFVPPFFLVAQAGFAALFGLCFAEITILYLTHGTLEAKRECPDRLSNGDDYEVTIHLQNHFRFGVHLTVIDELPPQFQKRDFAFSLVMKSQDSKVLEYSLRPVDRGEYEFGNVILLVTTRIGLFQRKIKRGTPQLVKVYPSFIKLHQYELLAISQNLTMVGEKRVRRVGNSREFDTIKDYVAGDDPRHINWAATARRGHLMTNHFIDERAQNVICILDKSRAMKMPFEGVTLLDYAINASLVISDVSLKRGDRSGLLAFENKIDSFVQPGNRSTQLYELMESLYRQKTGFNEPDFSSVYNFCNKNLNQRSLLLLFTNFESIHSLRRQLGFIKLLNRKHLVLLIYFRNTEVDEMIKEEADTTRKIYDQAIARQMLEEKLLIKDELSQHGVLSLYTSPKNLNVDVINKYIEIKSKRIL